MREQSVNNEKAILAEKEPGKVKRTWRKTLRILFKFVFSHAMVTILLVILQIVILLWTFFSLSEYSPFFAEMYTIMSLLILIVIINRDDQNPVYQLAWVIPICALPVLGVCLYVFGNLNLGGYGVRKRILSREKKIKPFIYTDQATKQMALEDSVRFFRFSEYMENYGDAATYQCEDARFYALGDHVFEDIIEDLKNAKEYIFIEYFIIARGKVWNTVLEILKEKVKEGVEVRVIYDGMCSLVNLPYNYPKKLQEFGIKAKQFSPIKPILSTHQNNRDHRKILVVDGKIAYTGGVNLADEYMNLKVRFGHWKDTSIRITGQAVMSFTAMFLQAWDLDEAKVEDYDKLLKRIELDYDHAKGFVIPYGDGPHRAENVAERVYLNIINEAEQYVHIMSPYLILDHEMLLALTYAARRGVDVTLIMPHVPDKKIAFYIARTFYPALIEGGVKVYEYTPGFVHAKGFISDDIKAVCGSINLDYRSLYLHYECGVYLYHTPVILDMEKDFLETLTKCEPMTLESYRKLPIVSKIIGRIFRFFGPLM